MLQAQIHLALPAWVHDAVDPALPCPDDEAKVALAVRLSALNVAHGTGGPFGAAIFDGRGHVVSVGVNHVVPQHCSVAHAEMMALRKAGLVLENYRLCEATIYVTLEPCVMCMGAISHARIKRLVFGAFDPKRGAVCNALSLTDADFLNRRISWVGGVIEMECSDLLRDFFRARR